MGIQLTDVFQYFLDTSDTDTAAYTQVTEDSAFDPSTDQTTYSPSYKDRRVQPEYVTGVKVTIDFEVDIMENQTLQDWFKTHEWDINVPTKLVRVDTSSGTASSHPAIMGAFVMNENPIDGSAGEALKATGSLKMTDANWTKGTFNMDTRAFTAENAG